MSPIQAAILAATLALSGAATAEDGSQPDAAGFQGPARKPAAADPSQSVAGLIQALRDRDEAVREKAAEALGAFDPPALEAVDALIEALDDGAAAVRHRAAEALERIGTPKARKASMRYRKRLKRRKSW